MIWHGQLLLSAAHVHSSRRLLAWAQPVAGQPAPHARSLVVCAACVWFCSVSICCVLCVAAPRGLQTGRHRLFYGWAACSNGGFGVLAAGCCLCATALQLEARQRPVLKSCASLFVGCRCLAVVVIALICVPVFGTQRECAVPLQGVCVCWPTGGWGFEFCNKDIAKKRGLAEVSAGASHPNPACPGAACTFFLLCCSSLQSPI
jgi:hypothetical protein